MQVFLLFHMNGCCGGEFLGVDQTMQKAEARRDRVWSNRNCATTHVLYDKEDLVIREEEIAQ